MTGPYGDIMGLPRHVSAARPQMPVANRAAQFAPFAALTGYDAVIRETARLTGVRVEPDEDAKADLEMKLNVLADVTGEPPYVVITHFRPDGKKEGGVYVTAAGNVKKINGCERFILMTDGNKIALDDILDIECGLFEALISPR